MIFTFNWSRSCFQQLFFLNAKNPRYYKHMVLQKLNMMSRWRWWCNDVMMTLTAMMRWCHYDDGDDDVMLIQEKNDVMGITLSSRFRKVNNRLTSSTEGKWCIYCWSCEITFSKWFIEGISFNSIIVTFTVINFSVYQFFKTCFILLNISISHN